MTRETGKAIKDAKAEVARSQDTIMLSAEEAIRAARDAEPARAGRVDPNEPNGYRAGDRVTVVPEDYGRDAVTGELVASDPFEVAIRRTDERVGEVVVHFPRQGYLMTPCA